MRINKIIYSIIIIIIGIGYNIAQPSPDTENAAPTIIEKCRIFYQYEDYIQSIKTARVILAGDYPQEYKEEALYYINESAEELTQDLQERMRLDNAASLKAEAMTIYKKYKIRIYVENVGYDVMIFYDKAYYFALKSQFPASSYIARIELRQVLRSSQIAIDAVQRYNHIIRALEVHKEYIEKYPESEYIPNIKIRIAKIYWALAEMAPQVKEQVGLTQSEIQQYAKIAENLFDEVSKKYPLEAYGMKIARIRASVRMRSQPSNDSRIIRRLSTGTVVQIIERTDHKIGISNMYDYWYKVQLLNGSVGWVFGFYLDRGQFR